MPTTSSFLIVTLAFTLASLRHVFAGEPASTCGAQLPSGPTATPDFLGLLSSAKDQSGKKFSEIARHCNLTNVYVAQLFRKQAQLKAGHAEECLKSVVPALAAQPLLLEELKKPPARRFDPSLIQEPFVYRFYEAVMHYGEAMRAVVNEEFGDGIMSAIDFYMDIQNLEGKSGEARVVVTMNGKYLPFVEQRTEDNVAVLLPTGRKQEL